MNNKSRRKLGHCEEGILQHVEVVAIHRRPQDGAAAAAYVTSRRVQ